jgi:O-antigen ligase
VALSGGGERKAVRQPGRDRLPTTPGLHGPSVRTRALIGAGAVAALAVLARAGAVGLGVSAVAVVALLAANVLVVRRSLVVRRLGARESGPVGGPLGACWLLVTLLPLHSFVIRPTTVAVTQLGIEPLIELSYFLVVGAYAVIVIARHERGLDGSRPPVLLLALPVWTIATAAWGPYGPYAFARGLQMLMLALLAWATIAASRGRPDVLADAVGTYVRWLVRLAVLLVGVGLALGPIFIPAGGANLERFTWMGAHPNASGLVLACACVVALTAPTNVLRLRSGARTAAVVVMVVALYSNHSRMSWLEVVVGALVAFGLAGRLRPVLRWVGTPLIGMTAFAATVFWGEQIGSYLAREGNSESLGTGNGRLQLWSVGLDALATPFDWAFGLGYGVTRTMFLEVGPWARNAHNSLLAWLVSGGVVALLLFLAIVGTTLRDLVRARIIRRPDGLAVVGLLVVLGVNGLAADAMAEPTMGLGGLLLLAAVGRALAADRAARHEDEGLPAERPGAHR